MGRRINSVVHQATGGNQRVDEYFDRVIKYIPADIVGAWVAVTGFVPRDSNLNHGGNTILWLAFFVGLLLSGAWTAIQTKEEGKPVAVLQITISTIAFAVWVVALGRPFDSIVGYQQYYGSLLLVAFTVISGRLVPKN